MKKAPRKLASGGAFVGLTGFEPATSTPQYGALQTALQPVDELSTAGPEGPTKRTIGIREPVRIIRTRHFQCRSFSRSDTCPGRVVYRDAHPRQPNRGIERSRATGAVLRRPSEAEGTPRERRARHRRSGRTPRRPAGYRQARGHELDDGRVDRAAEDRCKAGHAGTLDPLATGVLVVAVGRATKSIDRFMDTRKVYRTEIDLSAFTATDDREGEPRTGGRAAHDAGRRQALETHFSASSSRRHPTSVPRRSMADGPPWREGRSTEARTPLGPRPSDRARGVRMALATVEVECDKGFYVRSLAGARGVLGTGGHCARSAGSRWVRSVSTDRSTPTTCPTRCRTSCSSAS